MSVAAATVSWLDTQGNGTEALVNFELDAVADVEAAGVVGVSVLLVEVLLVEVLPVSPRDVCKVGGLVRVECEAVVPPPLPECSTQAVSAMRAISDVSRASRRRQ